MKEEEFFYQLSPELVLDSIEQAELIPSAQCQPLNSLENRVYSVVLENGDTVVAKFYRPHRWSKEQILEEHQFLFDLADAEIPVCSPMLFPDGTSLKQVDQIYFALWPLTGGREPDEFTDEELEILGRLLGRIHVAGESRQSQCRPTLNSAFLIDRALGILKGSELMSAHLYDEYETRALSVKRKYDEVSEGVPLQRIHGDCHLGNLLKGPEGWFFLDFDDFTIGPAVQDLWMLIQETGQKATYQMNVVLDGYRQFKEFRHDWLQMVEPLRAMRFIHFSGWIAKRWQDPAFEQAFPHFGTEEYWVGEIDDLTKQLGMFGGELPYVDDEPKEELTNKDFFFDMDD